MCYNLELMSSRARSRYMCFRSSAIFWKCCELLPIILSWHCPKSFHFCIIAAVSTTLKTPMFITDHMNPCGNAHFKMQNVVSFCKSGDKINDQKLLQLHNGVHGVYSLIIIHLCSLSMHSAPTLHTSTSTKQHICHTLMGASTSGWILFFAKFRHHLERLFFRQLEAPYYSRALQEAVWYFFCRHSNNW